MTKNQHSTNKVALENVMEQIHLENSYEQWVKNFGLNLVNIWKEPSAKNLILSDTNKKNNSAIVIGAGPSIHDHKHLELLAKSNFKGSIICTDRILIPALKAGITPKKFPKFYVITIDTAEKIKKFYDNEIVKKYGSKINGIFTIVTNPKTLQIARKNGININWMHALFDYSEGKKSFNQISSLMIRAKNSEHGLPGIQTGGNVGTSAWFVAWKILKCKNVCLIGINHSWNENDEWEKMAAHCNIPLNIDKKSHLFKKLFPTIYNPEFDCKCVLDPVFQYYSNALKDFITRTPSHVKTINATQGGCIFGRQIICMTLQQFLKIYEF
jgi:hypothetical protein